MIFKKEKPINDTLVHYMVTKNSSKKVNIQKIIQNVIYYVQTNEIYFEYMPNFWNGVLIFGIVGITDDQTKLQQKLGKIINKLNGKLEITDDA